MSVASELHPRGGASSGASSGEDTGCPDWRRLVAERNERRDDPLGWTAALRHLDGCVRCRERALAADPLLLFRRLPRVAASAASAGAATASAGEITIDVEAMKRGVATLRRTSALQGGASAPAREIRRLRRRLSLAAATVLLVVTAGLSPVSAPSPQPSRAAGMDQGAVVGFAAAGAEVTGSLLLTPAGSLFEAAGYEAFGGGVAGAWDEPQILAPTASSIEDLDLPNSRVYQIAGDDVAIAMIFNKSFDV